MWHRKGARVTFYKIIARQDVKIGKYHLYLYGKLKLKSFSEYQQVQVPCTTRRSFIMMSPPTTVQLLYYSNCTDVGGVTGLYFVLSKSVPGCTLNILKLTISKMSTVGLTRQQILFHHLTHTFSTNNMKI